MCCKDKDDIAEADKRNTPLGAVGSISEDVARLPRITSLLILKSSNVRNEVFISRVFRQGWL